MSDRGSVGFYMHLFFKTLVEAVITHDSAVWACLPDTSSCSASSAPTAPRSYGGRCSLWPNTMVCVAVVSRVREGSNFLEHLVDNQGLWKV